MTKAGRELEIRRLQIEIEVKERQISRKRSSLDSLKRELAELLREQKENK